MSTPAFAEIRAAFCSKRREGKRRVREEKRRGE
jgi:hypothetical protein